MYSTTGLEIKTFTRWKKIYVLKYDKWITIVDNLKKELYQRTQLYKFWN